MLVIGVEEHHDQKYEIWYGTYGISDKPNVHGRQVMYSSYLS